MNRVGKVLRIFLFVLVIALNLKRLPACDMMALISLQDHTVSELSEQSGPENDPLDFFQFLIERSTPGTNNDGYGIITYREGFDLVPDSQRWFKTGFGRWYGDGGEEPLNDAVSTIMTTEYDAVIVLGHDRNAGQGYGSHPFLLQWQEREYSFIHNGTLDTGVKTALMYWLGGDWFQQYPSNWEGEFDDVNSFIDSEILFHYIMSSIISCDGDVVPGIFEALHAGDILGYDLRQEFSEHSSTINFVLSDGEALYVFRNSPSSTVRNLCYQVYATGFIGVKTIGNLENIIEPNSLVVLSREQEPQTYEFYFAGFSAQPLTGAAPLTVDFTTGSGEEIESWAWDFENDGIIDSQGQNPLHTYQYPGSYDVRLTVSNGIITDSILKPDLIRVYDANGKLENILMQNYPNPFNSSTTIGFRVTENCRGNLRIYNLKGELVKILADNQNLTAGNMVYYDWDGRDILCREVRSGIYLYELKTSGSRICRKMVVYR